MKISLTREMFGKQVKSLCEIPNFEQLSKSSQIEEFWKAYHAAKDSLKNDYRVMPYDRFLQSPGDSKTLAADFGDYHYFLLIEGLPEKIVF